jgi:hypothetical protein
LALVGVLAAAGLGWWAYSLADPKAEAPPPPTAVGLPEVKPPSPLVSARELALREAVEKSPPHSREHLAAAFDLGVLLVGEHRYDDADKVFKQLEAMPRANKADGLPVSAAALGRFGQAIVLAHQDRWKESVAGFEAAVTAVPGKTRRADVEKLCFDHPAIGQAIAEGVNRNAENMPKGEKLPPAVAWLRTPSALLSGPK